MNRRFARRSDAFVSIVSCVLFCLLLCVFHTRPLRSQPLPPKADPTTVDVVRDFGGELFVLNSKPYLTPLVNLLNATTNARTFSTAVVGSGAGGTSEGTKKNSFYVRVGIHAMAAFVNPDQRTYAPLLPNEPLDLSKALQYVSGNILAGQVNIKDTAGLIGYAARVLINEGVRDGKIQVPAQAPTFFGNIQSTFVVPKEYFRERLAQGLFGFRLPASSQATILQAIERLPKEFLLPAGQNMSLLPLAVPQVEVGSLYGTELLVRYIPQLDWGNNIGRFGFWGVGVKHSLSQYIPNAPVELAAQAIVQGTSLSNRIGVTGAELEANASIIGANIHASKRFGIVEVFTGLSYDRLDIKASYKFVLPRQLQAELGLIRPIDLNKDGIIVDDEYVPDPANGYPGDTKPRTEVVPLSANNLRWTVGANLHLGVANIIVDYNLSSFSMLTAGVQVQF